MPDSLSHFTDSQAYEGYLQDLSQRFPEKCVGLGPDLPTCRRIGMATSYILNEVNRGNITESQGLAEAEKLGYLYERNCIYGLLAETGNCGQVNQ